MHYRLGSDAQSRLKGRKTEVTLCRSRSPDLDRWVSLSRLKGREAVGAVSNRAYGNEFRFAVPVEGKENLSTLNTGAKTPVKSKTQRGNA